MASARFHYANPVRPAGGAVPIRAAAWRLIGGNNKDLGCSAADFESPAASRRAVLELRARIGDAVPLVTIDPQSSEWTWRLEVDGRVVARSARGYLRHRECLYNVSHFLGSVPVAALPGEPVGPAALLAAKTPAALAWVAAILAIETARAQTGTGEEPGRAGPAGTRDQLGRSEQPKEAGRPMERAEREEQAEPCDLAGGAV